MVKTNESLLKNDGWKTGLSFCNGPFLGDMLIFGGVIEFDDSHLKSMSLV